MQRMHWSKPCAVIEPFYRSSFVFRDDLIDLIREREASEQPSMWPPDVRELGSSFAQGVCGSYTTIWRDSSVSVCNGHTDRRKIENSGGTSASASASFISPFFLHIPFDLIRNLVIESRGSSTMYQPRSISPRWKASLFRPRAPVSPQSPIQEHVANGGETIGFHD
jgi:hypothetical protein